MQMVTRWLEGDSECGLSKSILDFGAGVGVAKLE